MASFRSRILCRWFLRHHLLVWILSSENLVIRALPLWRLSLKRSRRRIRWSICWFFTRIRGLSRSLIISLIIRIHLKLWSFGVWSFGYWSLCFWLLNFLRLLHIRLFLFNRWFLGFWRLLNSYLRLWLLSSWAFGLSFILFCLQAL